MSAADASARARKCLCSFSFENVLAPGRYNPLFTLAHRGTGMDLIDRYEGAFSFVVTGPEAMGGAVDLPVEVAMSRTEAGSTGDRAVSAAETAQPGARAMSTETLIPREQSRACALRGPRPPDQGSTRAQRRLAALLAPHLQHRAQRIQAEVLRLGARLRLAGDAPAACCSACCTCSSCSSPTSGREATPAKRSTACSCSARSCCSRSSAKRPAARCAASSIARTSCARSSSRAWSYRLRSCCCPSSTCC